MSKLNERYFETKEKHKKSYKKQPFWLIALFVFMAVVIYYVKSFENSSVEVGSSAILDGLTNYAVEPITYSDSLFSVHLPSGFHYGNLDLKMRLMAISDDSTGTLLYVKTQSMNGSYPSLVGQWQKRLNDSNEGEYQFELINSDTSRGLRAELAAVTLIKSDEVLKGLIQISTDESNIYIVQGITGTDHWQLKEQLISNFISSFNPRTGM